MNQNKRPLSTWLLVFFLLVLALGGLAGAYGFLSDPSGAGMGMAPVLEQLPIPNFLLPGIFLLLGMFLFPLFLVYGLLARPNWSGLQRLAGWSKAYWTWAGALILGIGLGMWLAVQAALIGFSAPIQWFTAALDLGLLATTLAPATRAFYAVE